MKKLAALILCLMFLTACGQSEEPQTEGTLPESQEAESQTEPEKETEPEPEPEPEPENIIVTLAAVGDNLLHNTLSFDSRTDNGYDFSHIYAGVADRIRGHDIAFVNQEVPLDGTVGAYPVLSAPAEAADALKNIGFNVVCLANNHMADKGQAGLLATIENLRARDFGIIGGFDTREAADTPFIMEKNGVRIGFLAYTYGLNSGLGKDGGWMIKIADKDTIKADVEEIKPLCDFLVVSMHWGIEYQQEPSEYQQEYAQLLADLGADLVIGAHPHVMQPAQWFERENDTPMLCVYSLGNFVSGQRGQDRLIGGLLEAELEFTPDGEFIGFKEADIDGIITHYGMNSKGFALYMADDYSEELAAAHGIHKHNLPISNEFFTQRIQGIKESIAR